MNCVFCVKLRPVSALTAQRHRVVLVWRGQQPLLHLQRRVQWVGGQQPALWGMLQSLFLFLLSTICNHSMCLLSECVCVFQGGPGSSDPLVRETVRVQTAVGDRPKQADSHRQPQSPSTQRPDVGRHRQLRWHTETGVLHAAVSNPGSAD